LRNSPAARAGMVGEPERLKYRYLKWFKIETNSV
jgi:hypothetical protein